jgi:hypothetical protein
MSELYQSLSHSKWDCKYHVVFVSCRVCTKTTKEGHLRPNTSATGNHFPLTGPTEGMPDHRRPPDVGPPPLCASPLKHPVGISDRLSEREKRHRDRPYVAKNETSPASTSGPAVTQYPPSGSNWSRFAHTSANKMQRMEQPVNSEPTNEARNARRLNLWPNRL